MKQCPVCNSAIFDDMDICYGCMYRFDDPSVDHHPESEQPHHPGCEEVSETAFDELAGQKINNGTEATELFDHFLVEFHRFLGDFLVNRGVKIQ